MPIKFFIGFPTNTIRNHKVRRTIKAFMRLTPIVMNIVIEVRYIIRMAVYF